MYTIIDGVIRYFANAEAVESAEAEAKAAKAPKKTKRKAAKK